MGASRMGASRETAMDNQLRVELHGEMFTRKKVLSMCNRRLMNLMLFSAQGTIVYFVSADSEVGSSHLISERSVPTLWSTSVTLWSAALEPVSRVLADASTWF